MRTLPRAGAGLLALTLAFGVAACGDDDDEATGTTEASGSGSGSGVEGENAAFCDALIEFNGAVLGLEIDDTSSEDDIKEAGGPLADLTQTMADEAPEGLTDAAAEIHGFIEPMREGDATAFNSDDAFNTYSEFVGQATEACDFATVDVTGKDYAFEAPETVAAGNVAFEFTNASDAEEHEMLVVRKADGVSLSWPEIMELSEEESEDMVEFKAAAFAPPGEGSSTLAALTPGDYAMVCFVPVGGSEDGAPHFTQGMLHEFTVE